jgi:ubiquinone/menaquinone biosynthesis C-methylase UbiE
MNALRADLARSADHLRAFRAEQTSPGQLYELMAHDAVRQISGYEDLRRARVLDVGGGAGYFADAVVAAGGHCVTSEFARTELALHGRAASEPVLADGRALPFADAAFDVVHCSNVLEHCPEPLRILDDLLRVAKPEGMVYVSFTNWLSPWGGHETSPWHYLGGGRALARYERLHGRAKNRFGESLFPLSVGTVLAWLQNTSGFEQLDVSPRYLPAALRSIVRLPGVREFATWNLRVLLRKA